MRIAILFSGQGCQSPELLRDLRRHASPEMATALEVMLPEVWCDPDYAPGLLFSNRVAQPLIFAHQMTVWNRLAEWVPEPLCLAGYSLGEMGASCASGVFPAIEGLRFCKARAHAMDAAVETKCGFVAILGLTEGRVLQVAKECGVFVAIQNSSRHHVLGGTCEALAKAETLALASGATRTVTPMVSTPSHTPLLQCAGIEMERLLTPCASQIPLRFPNLRGIDGSRLWNRQDAVHALSRQIYTRLNWADCMQSVVEFRPDKILEIGPGNVLSRIATELGIAIPTRSVADFRTFEGLLEWLR